MRNMRSHLTYANVMVTIVAFVVLTGGTALASYVISKNSQIGPGTVSGHKPPTGDHANIIAGSVNGKDLAARSVQHSDLGSTALTAGFTQVQLTSATDTTTPKELIATCPAGKQVTGGGFVLFPNGASLTVLRSYPVSATEWLVRAEAITGTPTWQLNVYANCAG